MKRCALPGLLCCLSAAALAAGPDATEIEQARRALVECRIDAPATRLDSDWLEQLRWLQERALHETAFDESESHLDLAIVSRLRRAQQFELEDVYATDCRTGYPAPFRAGLAQLRPADPTVVRDAAWVPLLTARGEYLGIGLGFRFENGRWRLRAPESRVLGSDAESTALARQLGTRITTADPDDFQSCLQRLPPAPMPRDPKAAPLPWPEPADDSDNALGAAQRLATLRLAEGRGQPASVVAKLILAEALLRSLRFSHAPNAGTPKWLARVERAERLLAEARMHSVDWTRIAPMLVWLARAHETGAGGFTVDLALAQFYLDRAASTQRPEALEAIATRHQDSWVPEPPADDYPLDASFAALSCD